MLIVAEVSRHFVKFVGFIKHITNDFTIDKNIFMWYD